MWMFSCRSVPSSIGLDDTRAVDDGRTTLSRLVACRAPARRAVGEVGGGRGRARAAEGPGARRLRDQRRAALGEGDRTAAARARAGARRARWWRSTRSSRPRSPGPASSTCGSPIAFFLDALGGDRRGLRRRLGGRSPSACRSRWSRRTRPARSSSRPRATAPTATASRACSSSAATSVAREYYYNDAGAQMDRFRASIDALRRGEPVPEDGYQGEYVVELAARRGRPGAEDARVDRARRWSASASTSTAGRCRASSSSACPSSCRGSTPTRRTARSGRARPRTATSRTGC